MNVTRYKGKRFTVTIDRSTMERGYVLRTHEGGGAMKDHNKPLKRDAFKARFGFDPEWPHPTIRKKGQQ